MAAFLVYQGIYGIHAVTGRMLPEVMKEEHKILFKSYTGLQGFFFADSFFKSLFLSGIAMKSISVYEGL